jgi:site-specific recombinase XerD
MLDQLFRRPRVRDRVRVNLLGDWIELYVSYLHARGHPPGVIQQYAQAVEHLGAWLRSEHIALDAVTRATIDSFLHDHLPRCQCPIPAATCLYQVRAALAHLPHVPGVVLSSPEPASARDPVDVAVEHYVRYLRDICGLAESTCTYRARYALEFLRAKFADGPMRWEAIRPEDLMAFTAGYAARCRPQSARVASGSLRSLLRFLQLRGECGPALVAAVPHLPGWRLDHLPRTMTDEQLRMFLTRFDRSTPTGRRDYAMALCQVDLGLRVSEVSALRLEDLDWRAATLRIEGGKSRRTRALPLTDGVGRAIAEYLRRGRPTTTCRHVFVRHTVPVGTAVGTELIRGAIRRAFAGVEGCTHWTGTHALRHTAATRLHHRGASLKEVADLLGHQSIDTTAIYTKVDLPALASVALPWPEGQP